MIFRKWVPKWERKSKSYLQGERRECVQAERIARWKAAKNEWTSTVRGEPENRM